MVELTAQDYAKIPTSGIIQVEASTETMVGLITW